MKNITASVLSAFIFIVQQSAAGTISAALSLGSDVLSTQTTYTFSLVVETVLQQENHLIIEFDASLGVQIPDSVLSCTGVSGFTSANVPCLKLTSNQIRISCFLCDPASYPNYSITVNDITNPASSLPSIANVQVYSYEETTLIDTSNSIALQFSYITLASSAARITSENPTTGQLAPLNIELTIGSVFPSDGQVEILFPKWSYISHGATSEQTMVSSSITSRCKGTSTNVGTCSITLDSGTGSLDTVRVVGPYASGSNVAGGSTLRITLTNVQNPPTLGPRTSFEVNTMDQSGNYINKCSGVSLTLTTAFAQTSIAGSSVLLSGDSAPSREGTYQFTFQTTLPIPRGGSLRLTMPDEIDLPSGGINSIAVSGTSELLSTVSLTTGVTSKVIVFNNGFSSVYVDSGDSVSFQLTYLQNPIENTSTGSFQFHSFDENSYAIESLSFGLTIQAKSGQLTDVQFVPIETQQGCYQYASEFNLTFTLENDFTSTAQVVIEFASSATSTTEFALVTDQKCTVTSDTVSISSSVDCQVFGSQRQVTISYLSGSTIRSGSSIAIKLTGMRVRNPGSTRATASVYVYTQINGLLIDAGSSATFTPTPQGLLLASVTPSSLVTSYQNVDYTFSIQPSGPIPLFAVIKIILPAEIEINNINAIENDCNRYTVSGIVLNRGRQPSFNCDVYNQKFIKIERMFQYGEVSDFTTVTFTIPGIQNPRLLAQSSSSIQLFIYEDSELEYQIYNETSSLIVTMLEANPFSEIRITQASSVNKAVTNYQFQIEGAVNAQNEDIMEIQFPKQVQVGANVQCSGESFSLSPFLQCEMQTVTDKLRIIISVVNWRVLYTGIQKFTISISDITNSGTAAPTDPFTITLLSQDGLLIANNAGIETVTNQAAFELSAAAFEAQPELNELGVETNYRIALFPETFVVGMNLELKFPSQIEFVNESTIECSSLNNNVDSNIQCQYNPETEQVLISDAFTTSLYDPSQGLVFNIGTLRNPVTLQTTASFKITTKTSEGYLIDFRDSDLTVNFECLSPCSTCTEGTNNVCSACHQDGLKTNKSILANGKCIETCPLSQVIVQQSQTERTCEPCFDPNCEECSAPAEGLCQSCSASKQLTDGYCTEIKQEQESESEDQSTFKVVDKTPSTSPAEDGLYLFPFAMSAIFWAILSIILTRINRKRKSHYLPMAIPGVLLVSIIMALYDGLYLYRDKDTAEHANATLICAFGIPLFIQVFYLVLYVRNLKKDPAFKVQLVEHKVTTLSLISVSLILNYRFLKLSYTNVGDRFNLRALWEDTSTGWSPRRINMLLSTLMVPSDVALCFVAISAFQQPQADQRLEKVTIERVCISLFLASLTLAEFVLPLSYSDDAKKASIGSIVPEAGDKSKSEAYRMLTGNTSSSMLTDYNTVTDANVQNINLSDQYATNQKFLLQQAQPHDMSRLSQFEKEMVENHRELERSNSADKNQERRNLSRFIKKTNLMNSISECDSNAEADEGGYLSDPGDLKNPADLEKLYKVAPELRQDFGAPLDLRQKIKPHNFKSLDRLSNFEAEYIDESLLSDKDDGNMKQGGNQTRFSSENHVTQVEILQSNKSDSSVDPRMGVSPADFANQNKPVKVYQSSGGSSGTLNLQNNNDREPQKMVATITIDSEASADLDSLFKAVNGADDQHTRNHNQQTESTQEKLISTRNGRSKKKSIHLSMGTSQPRSGRNGTFGASLESDKYGQTPRKLNMSAYQHEGMKILPPNEFKGKVINGGTGRVVPTDTSRRRKNNSAMLGELIMSNTHGSRQQRYLSTQRDSRNDRDERNSQSLKGTHILYNASFKPHYYGMADYIETAEIKNLQQPDQAQSSQSPSRSPYDKKSEAKKE